jgi:signal transduction histidine kinase
MSYDYIPTSVKINDSILVSMNVTLAMFFKYILEKKRRKGYVRQLIIEDKEQQLKESLKTEKILSSLRKDLIGILAHDIRGPMNNLQSIIALLDAKTISSEKGEALLGQVHNRIEVITKGVNDLLIWIKSKETGLTIAIETFDAIEFLDEILEIGKTQLEEKNIQVELNVEPNLKVVSDKGAVQTVIRNVLSNAIKFSDNNSIIKIEANHKVDEVLFSITDQGVGISPEVIQKVSESFYTTAGTNKETGIGLGLQICFALLEKLESKLIIDSIKGQGTKMSFSLKNSQNQPE